MTLHKNIKGKNSYCAPYVLAAVTGISTDDAALAIRHHSGQRAVRGAYTTHLIKALADFGIVAYSQDAGSGLTLNQWFTRTSNSRAGKVFLVLTTDHFQLVHGDSFTDSITRDIVSIHADGVKRRSRVQAVYVLEGNPREPDYPHPCSQKHKEQTRQRKRRVTSARTRAKLIAKLWDISIDPDNSFDGGTRYWVDEPDGLCDRDDFPPHLDDERCRDDWEDVLDRVEEVVEYLKSIRYLPVVQHDTPAPEPSPCILTPVS